MRQLLFMYNLFISMIRTRRIFIVTIVTTLISVTTLAQSKLHMDLSYQYSLGLSEKFAGLTYGRDSYKMGGNSLQVTARYDIAARWSAGIGMGVARYTEPDLNTFPVFATLRYNPVRKLPQAYLFTDLGYGLKLTDDSNPGFSGKLGIGYTWMIMRHFGLNFQVAYNLINIRDIDTTSYDEATNEVTFFKSASTRHSISFGIGLTF